MKYLHFLVLILGLSLIMGSCSGDEEGTPGEMEMGTDNGGSEVDGEGGEANLVEVKIRLTDNPVELSAVNIDLVQLVVVSGDELIPLETVAGIYNLLDFQNGINTVIADQVIDITRVDQLILQLGDKNSVVDLDGLEFPLILPDDAPNYLTIDLGLDVQDWDELDVLLDFDACRSVHRMDNGQWVLEPVLKVMTVNGESFSDFDPAKIAMIIDELDLGQNGEISKVTERRLCLYDFKVLKVDIVSLDVNLGLTGFILGPDCNLLLKIRELPSSQFPDHLGEAAKMLSQGMDLYEVATEYSSQDAKYYEFRMLEDGIVRSFLLDADGVLVCR